MKKAKTIEYFVYVDRTDEDSINGFIPFYVGKGVYQRIKDPKRNNYHTFIAKRYGFTRSVEYIFDNDDDACKKEMELIVLYKTNKHKNPDALVANFTDGGDTTTGFKLSEESKKKLSSRMLGKNNPNYGHRWTKEMRENMSKQKTGTKMSEETKLKLSIAFKGKKILEETKDKIKETKIKIFEKSFGERNEKILELYKNNPNMLQKDIANQLCLSKGIVDWVIYKYKKELETGMVYSRRNGSR
jgi:hypothetical protein